MNSNYPFLQATINTSAPKTLFHYTSPAGLIGIAKYKTMWATHVQHLNDSKELCHAVEVAKLMIANKLRSFNNSTSDKEKKLLLDEMSNHVGRTSSDIYVTSFTEERDLLSQWRAYCPPSGGFAIGISSNQLREVAVEQGFFLSPCLYDYQQKEALVREIFNHHYVFALKKMNEVPPHSRSEFFIRDLAVLFTRELSKYGAILKHESFKEEKEWRLVSYSRGVNHSSVEHRAGSHTIIPYLDFHLKSDRHPNLARPGSDEQIMVISGPTRDFVATGFAMQSLMHKEFPEGFSMSNTSTPYRGV